MTMHEIVATWQGEARMSDTVTETGKLIKTLERELSDTKIILWDSQSEARELRARCTAQQDSITHWRTLFLECQRGGSNKVQ